MILTEYDEEKNTKTWFEDGIEEGKKEKAVETAENLLKEGDSPEKISRCIGLSLEKVLEIQKNLSVNA